MSLLGLGCHSTVSLAVRLPSPPARDATRPRDERACPPPVLSQLLLSMLLLKLGGQVGQGVPPVRAATAEAHP